VSKGGIGRELNIIDANLSNCIRRLELELESLVVPEVYAAEDAGKLLQDLPRLWEQSTLSESRVLLQAMLEAVYVDHKEDNAVVAIQPKPAFRAVFQAATTREGSGVILIKEPPDQAQKAPSPCLWWRRGRVELYHEHGLGVLIVSAYSAWGNSVVTAPLSLARRIYNS